MTKHVYILGAGFSVPLGGPLFTQLLTTELDFYWQQIEFDAEWHNVIRDIHLGRLQKILGRPKLDAEQLLHRVDWMSRFSLTPVSQEVFSKMKRDSMAPRGARTFFLLLNRFLKQVVACECEAFLYELEDGSDLWDPYEAWFKNLGPDDTIITFNYDTAIERIAEKTGRKFDRAKLCEASEDSMPRLIKLHGSADWVQYPAGIEWIPQAYRQDLDVAIGTPGLTKSQMHAEGHFKKLWGDAEKAIVEAEQVSIIGYSMPATDNRARMMILSAILAGRRPKQRICIVLGLDTPKIQRMLSIIRPVVGNHRSLTTDTSMYAQDYIANVQYYAMADY